MCAGEPAIGNRCPGAVWVYPRVCGGTACSICVQSYSRGLSPCVRGNLSAVESRVPVERSIPVCAGEPIPSRRRGLHLTVYPRVCGGTVPETTVLSLLQGLSPCVRGNRCCRRKSTRKARSIPVCAGEPPA